MRAPDMRMGSAMLALGWVEGAREAGEPALSTEHAGSICVCCGGIQVKAHVA
jgi:hypothetical protein